MANLARNSSVETAYGLTFGDGAARVSGTANTGTYSVFLLGSSALGGERQDTVEWELTKPVTGSTVTVSVAVNEAATSTQDLQLLADEGDGALTQVTARSTGAGTKGRWYIWNAYNFTALGPDIRIQLRAEQASVAGWFVDDLVVEGTPVAVKLAERALDSVVSLLQANLATELTAIDTDRGDGITMAAPANAQYYKREKAEIAGATAHVEVFEEDWQFDNPYSDAAAQRATYDLPVIVRVTCFNRDGDSADTMHKRKRRYAAGVFNVINKNDTLADSDDATLNAVVTDIETEVDRDEEDNISKVRATLRLLVKCEEVQ